MAVRANKMTIKIIKIAWLISVVAVTVGSFLGGDASIVCGWLFLILTAPFGAIWWFYVYAAVPSLVGLGWQYFGVIVSDVLAYAFWLIVLPRVLQWAHNWKPTRSISSNQEDTPDQKPVRSSAKPLDQ